MYHEEDLEKKSNDSLFLFFKKIKKGFKKIFLYYKMTRFYKGLGSQQKSFVDNPDCKFFVAQDFTYGQNNSSKHYAAFKSIDDFFNFEKHLEQKCCYETLKDGNQLIEIYDIDGIFSQDAFQDRNGNPITDEELISTFIDARIDFQVDNYPNIPLCYSDFLIKKTDDPKGEKLSLHFIIRNGYKFNDITHLKNHVTEFEKYCNGVYKIKIDSSIYSRNRLIRMLGHHKIGQEKRSSYRYKYHSMRNEICSRKLFFASYLEGDEKLYPTVSARVETDEEKQNRQIRQEIQLESIKVCDEDVIKLVKLILETVDDEKSQLCDSEIKNKMNYGKWYKFVITVFNCCQSEDTAKYLYSILFDYYRTGGIDYDKYYTDLYRYKGDYTKLTINSLHFYARENLKYKEIFKKEIKEYNEKFLKKNTQQNIKELTHTEGFIERKNENFVLTRDINKGSISVVKAGLGKGKTTATVNHINNFDYDCIIILTPRRAYAQSTLSRVNTEINLPDNEKFVLYSDIKGGIKHKYIIIQVESLCRFIHDFEKDNTLIILDEVESLLYQMTSHKTHGQNHVRNIEMFERMLTNSSKVLCMDAFISNRTLNILKNINKKFEYYNYTKNLEKRKAIEISKKNILKNKLIEELDQGKKIYFFCSSRKQLTDYFLPDIRQKFPHKKIIEYHSKKMSINLDKINDEWKQADLIVATCTITVGCNFDLQNVFSNIFVYASACSRNLVRDIFQSCYRVRHIIDKTMYFCLDTRHNGMNLPTSISEIKNTIENKVLFHKKHYEKFLKMEFTEETPKWVKDLLINNIFESNMSIMNLQSLFYKYLELCNYELVDDDDNDFDDLDLEDEINLIFEEYQYQDIPEITFTERQELLKKKKTEPLTELEEFKLNKSFFQATLITQGRSRISKEDQVSLWNVYCNFGKKRFRNLAYEKGIKAGTMRICDIISASFPEVADNLSRKLEDIIEITDKLGLDNSQDFKEIDRGTVFEILPWLEEHSTRFHVNFGLRNRMTGKFTLKNGSELLNKIFSVWGYSKIKKGKLKQKRVDGKRVDVSNYKCENTEDIDVYTHLEPKSKKQTDRKVRLLKEGEDPLEEKEE